MFIFFVMPEIKIPRKEEVPAKVKITFEETQENKKNKKLKMI